ncbi:MAG: glycosyltransferase family 39 protein [Desulfovibrio sp.]|jgi:4-amino-4-deoxy-L-arabinose transferase-like glycosyltransferase|nr:glycosyltransferase family 39 protein [Desulfovibrio sp.]
MQRLWDLMRRWPFAALAVLTAVQTVGTFSSRALWFSDEVRYADAYAGLLRGKWLVLNLNGMAYPDKPPLYFWFLRALDIFTGTPDPAVFFLGTAASGLLVLFAVLAWARVLRLPDETGLLAGLVLLTTFFFAGLLHYSRMDLLFAALIIASQAAFCLAFRPGEEHRRGRLAALAMLLAALATLTKGPLGLAFPILTTMLFLAWRGRAGEFFSRALLPGLGVLLAVVFSWVVAAYFVQGPEFLHKIFYEQIFQRATKTFHHAEPWYFYLIAFPPCWLPWLLAPVALPARTLARLFAATYWKELAARRKDASPEGDARAVLWISAVSGLTLLSLLSGKVVVYLLPQLPPLALLLALGLQDGRLPWRRLWMATALVFFALAAGASQGARFLPAPVSPDGGLPGTAMVAAGFAACGLGLLVLRNQNPRHVLLALALLTAAWVQPACRTLAPALDAIMSPKPQAMVLKAWKDQGYTPLAHDIYQGIYSYYLGGPILESANFEALDRFVAEKDIVLVIKKKKWDTWTTRPQHVLKIYEQWMAGQPYYVALSRKDGSPPPLPSDPGPDRVPQPD